MIPLRDANPTRRTPVVTLAIVIACFVAFGVELFALASGGEDALIALIEQYGTIPAELTAALKAGQLVSEPVLDVFTSMFLHAGWLHLLANMLVLYLAGPFLEEAWGRKLYAGFYVAAGLFAGGMYALLERQLQAPLIGASGAVAGVLGAFLLLRGKSRIRFAVIFGLIGTFTAPAWIMLPLWFVGELLDALAGDVAAAGAGGVAY